MRKSKVLALVLAAAMAVGLCGCGGGGTSSSGGGAVQAETGSGGTASETEAASAEAAGDGTDMAAVENVWDLIDSRDMDFKIGIMSSSVAQAEETYRTTIRLQEKYGEDKIIVDTFPAQAVSEQETTISKVMAMASDPQVKAIVFNQAQDGTIAAIKKLKEVRDDVLTVACNPNEDYDEMATVADVVLVKDQLGFADQVANLAVQMGAKSFVHYSFPRHMSNQNIAKRCERMREICEENGIAFYEVTTPDPQGDSGTAGTQQFILEDVPRQIKDLGEDTVFFSTNTAMHEPIIKCVMEGHAMYCGQSDPTPFDGFPAALGIEVPEDKMGDSEFMLNAIQEKVDEAGMNGRISTWPSSLNMMYTQAGTMFAILHGMGISTDTNGEKALEAMQACYRTLSGEGAEVNYWTNNDGKEYDYVFRVLGSQHIFE
ncbi:MAG: DUF3798 domain-containing protein [Eubacteriales bacterium]|nr:DUF3798 domain-containing protein [Eubacteriales bacterium]